MARLIEGWQSGRFVTYRPGGRVWSYVLVPGWQELLDGPLEEICAAQYVRCNEAALDDLEALPRNRWTDVGYEDLVADPHGELERICAAVEVPFDAPVRDAAEAVGRTPTASTVTPPRPDKWREQNPKLIERVRPLTEPTERRLDALRARPAP